MVAGRKSDCMIRNDYARNIIFVANLTAPERPVAARPIGIEQAAKIALVAFGYFATAKLALLFGSPTVMPLVFPFPPAGIGLAAPLVFGFRVWPGILIGALLHGFTTAGDPALHLVMAAANTLEALVGAWLVQRFAGGVNFYEKPRSIARFALLAGLLSPLLSPPIGVPGIAWHNLFLWDNNASEILVWWLGEAMSVMVLTPLLVIWNDQPRLRWNLKQGVEFGGLLLLLILVGLAVFTNLPPAWAQIHLLPYLCVPFTIWAAMRFGARATAITTCVLSLVALWGTFYGYGMYSRAVPEKTLMAYESFISVTSILGLIVAAIVTKHRRTEEALKVANVEMDHRIEERTEQLRTEIETRKRTEQFLAEDIVRRKKVEAELTRAHDELDERVQARTTELVLTNRELENEVSQRRRTELTLSKVLHQLIDAQETERQRISRELHDELGQDLTAMKLGLKMACQSDRPCGAAQPNLQHLDTLADRLMRNVHRLAWELRPPALDDFGLVQALQRYTEEWSKHSGIMLDFHHGVSFNGLRLSPKVETTLYRITQEALTNVKKHSAARRVSVILENHLEGTSLIIEDDGRGFANGASRGSPGPNGGLGLLGMQERVLAAGGPMDIESSAGGGTSIFVRVPLPDLTTLTESL